MINNNLLTSESYPDAPGDAKATAEHECELLAELAVDRLHEHRGEEAGDEHDQCDDGHIGRLQMQRDLKQQWHVRCRGQLVVMTITFCKCYEEGEMPLNIIVEND